MLLQFAKKDVGEPRFEQYCGPTYNNQFDWHWRRAVKMGNTSQNQDFVRAYETIPAGTYRHNIEVRQQPLVQGGRIMGEGFIAVENLESRFQPRRVAKRQALGSEAAKRRKRSFARNFEEGTRIIEEYEARNQVALANRREGVQDSITKMLTDRLGEKEDGDAKTRIIKVHFQDEGEDDWTDVEKEGVGEFLKEGGGSVISTVPEEYVLV